MNCYNSALYRDGYHGYICLARIRNITLLHHNRPMPGHIFDVGSAFDTRLIQAMAA
jgi:hypothetical protein